MAAVVFGFLKNKIMLIVKIKAGLGNQMFQYSFGRVLSLIRKESLFLDVSFYENQVERNAKREYLLNHFNIEAEIASDSLIKKFNSSLRVFMRKLIRRIRRVDDYTYYPYLMKSKSSYYEGHWANEKYFLEYESIIRKELSLKKPLGNAGEKISKEISSSGETSVSLHIRRGDFVSNPHSAVYNGLIGIPYYEKASGILASKFNIRLFVFTDDIVWAKNNLKLPYPTVFVSNPNIPDYEEIVLMSKCSHHILANSTFSWWGAWLNPDPNKIVIVPKQWLLKQTTEEIDLIPEKWIKI